MRDHLSIGGLDLDAGDIAITAADVHPPGYGPRPDRFQRTAALLVAASQAGLVMRDFARAMARVNLVATVSAEKLRGWEDAILERAYGRTFYGTAAIAQLCRELGCLIGRHRWSRRSETCLYCGVGRHDTLG